MTVQNPHDEPLSNVCASLHSAHLTHVASPMSTIDGDTAVQCFAMGPKASEVVEFVIQASEATEDQLHTLIGKVYAILYIVTALYKVIRLFCPTLKAVNSL